jgi:hypothetical protein
MPLIEVPSSDVALESPQIEAVGVEFLCEVDEPRPQTSPRSIQGPRRGGRATRCRGPAVPRDPLRLVDWPAQSDTKPVPTTAPPVAPPSAAAPAVTTPPTRRQASPPSRTSRRRPSRSRARASADSRRIGVSGAAIVVSAEAEPSGEGASRSERLVHPEEAGRASGRPRGLFGT